MRLLKIGFAFFAFIFLSSCGSKDSNEEALENLYVALISEFSANEETQSVTVTSNLDWTASTDSNWITVSPSNGTNTVLIDISVTANPTENKRTGTVTIAGGTITKTLTIIQAAKNASTVGGLDPNKAPSENFDLSTWN